VPARLRFTLGGTCDAPGMDTTEQRAFGPPAVQLTIDRELDLVESAIDFVLSGASRRVTVAGLRFGRQILAAPTIDRFRGRVRLEPLWRFDGSGCDITVLADG
jgi:hypothetical protein